ncbi:MAG: AAA family ATPase [Candidatus Nomurabacteria bacterium]|nr:AAA family ATPase [Candidatus Nomurabacteria bacterium]
MKLIIMFGPQAVGKMTVGHELEKITNLKLFHNHMTIDLVNPFFNYDTEIGKKLVRLFREEIFKEVASSDQEGLVFTFQWDFDRKETWDYIENVARIFTDKGAEIFWIELEADMEERIKRNKTDHRLKHKPTKRNIKWSEKDLKDSMLKHRLNSKEGEIKEKNYLRINNTNINAYDTALIIKDKFNL